MRVLVWQRLSVVVLRHCSLQILHEPPPCFLSCLSSALDPSNTITQLRKTKKGRRKTGLGEIFTKVLYLAVYYSDWVWVNRETPKVTVCNGASASSNVPLSPVFLSSTLCSYLPLAFSLFIFCFVCFYFLYLNLYLLFRLLLNLSVISKWKKMNKKKNTKCLKNIVSPSFLMPSTTCKCLCIKCGLKWNWTILLLLILLLFEQLF